MKILLLSPYDANSHQHWWRLLQQYFKADTWTVLTLPARYFSWRIRSNGLTWSYDQRDTLVQHYDLCIATSMTDLATLRGLLPSLSDIPTVLYFHENQAAYPVSNRVSSKVDKQKVKTPGASHNIQSHNLQSLNTEPNNIEPLMVQLYSSIAASHLCFNSDYNKNSFFHGLGQILKKFPDGVPKGIITELECKSSVIPVPIEYHTLRCNNNSENNSDATAETISTRNRSTLVWNHRWEYDKSPARLLAFIQALPSAINLTLHVLGQSFRQTPLEFDEIKQELQNRGWLGRWGYIADRQEYYHVLNNSMFVLSTAEHDFQGISVLEAVSQGCIPIVPDRLAYCEMFDDIYRYASDINMCVEAKSMSQKVQDLINTPDILAPDVSRFCIQNLGYKYQKLFSSLT